MKILSGKYKGRNFYQPAGIRPTQNITRHAIFDILGHDLRGIRFLDLFAGSGAVGLEALSLAAAHVVFVEKNPQCLDVLRKNLALLNLSRGNGKDSETELVEGDAMATIKKFAQEKRKFDMIFLDPPYGLGLAKKTLKTLMAYDIVHANCFLIVEHSRDERFGDSFEKIKLLKERRYGKSEIAIYEFKPQPI